jgi:hypothetical protein
MWVEVNSEIFKSNYVKGLIKGYNDYYIGKGYRPFTEKDKSSMKLDYAQMLRKFFHNSFNYKLDINFFNNSAVYGIFATHDLKKIAEHHGISDGSVSSNSNSINNVPPYCIVYVTPENRILVRRLLYITIKFKQGKKPEKLNQFESEKGSGGKEIGAVQ